MMLNVLTETMGWGVFDGPEWDICGDNGISSSFSHKNDRKMHLRTRTMDISEYSINLPKARKKKKTLSLVSMNAYIIPLLSNASHFNSVLVHITY